MNKSFFVMVFLGFLYAVLTGRTQEAAQSVISAGGEALETVLGLCGAFMLFGGINRVIEKCARYGIGVYLFAIEPYCLDPADAKLCPALAGNRGWSGRNVFCVRSTEGKAFCREMGLLSP